MKKAFNVKFLAVLAALAIIVSVGWYMLRSDDVQAPVTSTQEASAVKVQSSESVTFFARPGMSVLEQLKANAVVETKQSEYGTLVESINGLVNGTDGKYWLFYVDGTMADKGADAYITNGGESIEWKFEK